MITHAIIECSDEENEDWYTVVSRWTEIRPDWQHKTEYEDGAHVGDAFIRHYYNIQILNKKDLLDVFELFAALNVAYPESKIEWITKTVDASLSIKASNVGFRIAGGPIMSQINDRACGVLKAIKDLVKNY